MTVPQKPALVISNNNEVWYGHWQPHVDLKRAPNTNQTSGVLSGAQLVEHSATSAGSFVASVAYGSVAKNVARISQPCGQLTMNPAYVLLLSQKAIEAIKELPGL